MLLSLPSEIVDLIAYFSAIDLLPHPAALHAKRKLSGQDLTACTVQPGGLSHLLLTCRQLHRQLELKRNPLLYADVFRAKFDAAAIGRRFGQEAVSSQALADEYRRRCIILKRIRAACREDALRPEGNNELGAANLKENLWLAYMMMLENDGQNLKSLEWADIHQYLQLHHTQEMLESAIEPGYPPDSEDRALAVHIYYLITDPARLAQETKDDAEERLFVLRPFVFASHKFESFFAPWTLKTLPIQRPEDTIEAMDEVEKARTAARAEASSIPVPRVRARPLPGSSSHRSNTESPSSSSAGSGSGSKARAPSEATSHGGPSDGGPSAESPSTHRGRAQPARTPASPFVEDLSPKVRSTVITHCGQRITIRPPILALAAYPTFFGHVERNPSIVGLTAIVDRGSEPGTMDRPGAPGPPRPATQLGLLHPTLSGGRNGEQKMDSPKAAASLLTLRSEDHDQDVTRLVACHDPYRSPGLRPCFFEGAFEGAWEGRFSFFDFDSYREMLAGRMRSLYEGPFGEQPQVWKLKEHFVRVGEGYRKEMGQCSMITAGFHLDEPLDELLKLPRSVHGAKEQAREKGQGKRGPGDGDSQTQETTGKSKQSRLSPPPADYHLYPQFSEEEGGARAGHGYIAHGTHRPGASEERYEMLISGIGHSAWGRFILRGRVRAWDGMVVLSKEYNPDGRGRWIYRGYVLAGGSFVGRWRDSFTPGELSGYEGPFVLNKRDGKMAGDPAAAAVANLKADRTGS